MTNLVGRTIFVDSRRLTVKSSQLLKSSCQATLSNLILWSSLKWTGLTLKNSLPKWLQSNLKTSPKFQDVKRVLLSKVSTD